MNSSRNLAAALAPLLSGMISSDAQEYPRPPPPNVNDGHRSAADHHHSSSATTPPPTSNHRNNYGNHHHYRRRPSVGRLEEETAMNAVFSAADASLVAFWRSALARADVNAAARRRRGRYDAARCRHQQEAVDVVVEENVEAAARTQAAACIAWVLAAISIVFADHEETNVDHADVHGGEVHDVSTTVTTDSDSRHRDGESVIDMGCDSASRFEFKPRRSLRQYNRNNSSSATLHDSRQPSRLGQSDWYDHSAVGDGDVIDMLAVRQGCSGDSIAAAAVPSTYNHVYDRSRCSSVVAVETIAGMILSNCLELRECDSFSFSGQQQRQTIANRLSAAAPPCGAVAEITMMSSDDGDMNLKRVGRHRASPRWQWRPRGAGCRRMSCNGDSGKACAAEELMTCSATAAPTAHHHLYDGGDGDVPRAALVNAAAAGGGDIDVEEEREVNVASQVGLTAETSGEIVTEVVVVPASSSKLEEDLEALLPNQPDLEGVVLLSPAAPAPAVAEVRNCCRNHRKHLKRKQRKASLLQQQG